MQMLIILLLSVLSIVGMPCATRAADGGVTPTAAPAVVRPAMIHTLMAEDCTAGCIGDCGCDGVVSVDELLIGVNILLGSAAADACTAMDANRDAAVTVDEIVTAVRFALNGCPEPSATPTATATVVPTPDDGWEVLRPLPGARQEDGVAELGGLIYVVGGFDANISIVPTVERYDPATDTWSVAASLPEALHHVAVAAVAERLYAIGGLRGYSFTEVDSMFAYDPSTDEWTPRATLPRPRGAAAVAVIDGRIYAAGGLRGGASIDDFAVYDATTDVWHDLPPMPTARDHHGAAAVDAIFYAIGGRTGQLYDVVEAYDTRAGTWSTRAPMPTARGGLAVAALNGHIYAMGGEGNTASALGTFPQTEVYSPETDAWASLPNMRTARHGTGAAAFGDRIFVPGGATHANFGPSAANEALSAAKRAE